MSCVRRFLLRSRLLLAVFLCGSTLLAQDAADAEGLLVKARAARDKKRYAEAAPLFAAAADAFAARVKEPPKDGDLPPDLEAAAAARCAQAEMLLRLDKTAEARDLAAALLKDRTLGRSRSRPLALYQHGFACLARKDALAAGRSLSQLAPFDQGPFALHARYLLAVVHHQDEEFAEAAAEYEAVVAAYEGRKAQAVETLGKPEELAKDPNLKARLEAFVKAPPPAYVGDALFALGTLDYEAGLFANAQPRFAAYVRLFPTAALNPQARLLNGMCLVRLERFDEAAALLRPVAEKEPTLAGSALLWIARAQAASASPDDPEAHAAALKDGLETLRRAGEQFKTAGDNRRYGEALFERAELFQRAGEPQAAVLVLTRMIDDKLLSTRDEEIRQRKLTALSLAGDHAAALALCERFVRDYPKSPLLPEAVFRRAESAFFLGRSDEAARGYQQLLDKHPEFGQVNAARYGLAWTHYRKGDLEKARAVLTTIPPNERDGELAFMPYLLADCLLRTTPSKADDALAVGKVSEQLNQTVDLLNEFVALQPDDPAAPEALLRLGFCQQRLASFAGKDEERNQAMGNARASYERVFIDYPVNALQPYAAFGRARVVAATGDPGEALKRLRLFARGPFADHPAAVPAALLRATLLRNIENGAPEAVKVLADCRKQHEKALLKDPTRAAWVPLLQFHHAVALHEANRFREARAGFDALRKQYPDRPESAEALLQWGRALADEGAQAEEQANQALGMELKPADAEAARKRQAEGRALVRDALRYFEEQAAKLKDRPADADVRARLLYAAAWGHRSNLMDEIEAARSKRQEELHEKLKQEAAKKVPEGQPVPEVPPPEVPAADIAPPPSEVKTRELYRSIIADFADAPLAIDVLLELAELHVLHKEHAEAIKLLDQAIDKEPPPEMTARIRLRLGECRAAQGDYKAALGQFEAVTASPDGGQAAQGLYRAAECQLRLKDVDGAIQRLTRFRDEEPLRGIGGVSDRALLRLGQIHGKRKQGDECRKAYETLLNTFGNDNGWSVEAHYGFGWSLYQQGDIARAQESFEQASGGEAVTEPTARARLLVGVCLIERKKYAEALEVLRALPEKYPPIADVCALALIEAAHAARLNKQADEATKLLQRVLKEHPQSAWAATARDRLKDAKGAPHELPAVIQALTPDTKDWPSLDQQGQQKDLRASLDDPTDEMTQTLILARTPRPRTTPAPALPLSLPDPFALQRELPLRGPLPIGTLPVLEAPPRP